jgi:hypothetical protein
VTWFRADRQETSTTIVRVSITRPDLAIPPLALSSWHTCLIDRKGGAPVRRARPWEQGMPLEKGAPLGEGRAQSCLMDWKGRAPVDQGTPT